MHDKRDESGMYRPLTSTEQRACRARELTQTHEGMFTHERSAPVRRNALGSDQMSAKLFKNKRVNRDKYMPKGI